MPQIIILVAGWVWAALTAIGVEAGLAASIANILAPALVFGHGPVKWETWRGGDRHQHFHRGSPVLVSILEDPHCAP